MGYREPGKEKVILTLCTRYPDVDCPDTSDIESRVDRTSAPGQRNVPSLSGIALTPSPCNTDMWPHLW